MGQKIETFEDLREIYNTYKHSEENITQSILQTFFRFVELHFIARIFQIKILKADECAGTYNYSR